MFERALRLTFRNYSTLFLLVACFSVTASLVYCFIFRNTIAVHELHDLILTFPGERQVAGVGRERLLVARYVGRAIVAGGIALLPFLAGCARRIVERDDEGHAPTVVDALRSRSRVPFREAVRTSRAALIPAAVVALVTGVLSLMVGLVISEVLSEGRLWVGVGLSRGVAWAIGAPFVLVPLALSSRPSTNL